ncbi:MAG: hypothetical protein A2901_05985 [Elusimicrobia bacterium RIFCSPLOWO2_01_FULL_54_10]|nr:MAG: hypothetical protein A2901_05985 [Elusimicrobia bacterium RIFCSPLOWO2_01_FULL_54_10]
MLKKFIFGLILSTIISSQAHSVEVPPADRERIETSIRKSLSVLPNWQIRLLDAQPSQIDHLYQGNVEFKQGDRAQNQTIFISHDFKKYIVGNVFNAEEDSDKVRMSKIRLQGAPSQGPSSAKVTIVEYSDLQCPSCKVAYERMKADKIVESYSGKVRLVFKHRPFPNSHNWAMDAAVASVCARQQAPKAFWNMVDSIFVHQSSITPANFWDSISGYAKDSKLDLAVFKKCFDDKAALAEVNADMAEADALGVAQTPTLFVNGRAITGYPGPQNMRLLIDEFLKQK